MEYQIDFNNLSRGLALHDKIYIVLSVIWFMVCVLYINILVNLIIKIN